MKTLILIIISIIISGANADELESYQIPDFPTANYEIITAIDSQIAICAAQRIANEIWENPIASTPVPCTDVDGIISYYMVPFALDHNDTDLSTQFFNDRNESKEMVYTLVNNFKPVYTDLSVKKGGLIDSLALQEDGFGNDRLRKHPSVRPDGSISHRIQYARCLDSLKKSIYDIQPDTKYGTVIISARSDRMPIAGIYCFIPPFYITGIDAKRLASEKLNTQEYFLNNIIFINPGEIFYCFQSDNQEVLVHCKTLKIIEDVETFRNEIHRYKHLEEVSLTESDKKHKQSIITQAWEDILK